jgi:hypothetical protein
VASGRGPGKTSHDRGERSFCCQVLIRLLRTAPLLPVRGAIEGSLAARPPCRSIAPQPRAIRLALVWSMMLLLRAWLALRSFAILSFGPLFLSHVQPFNRSTVRPLARGRYRLDLPHQRRGTTQRFYRRPALRQKELRWGPSPYERRMITKQQHQSSCHVRAIETTWWPIRRG